MCRNSLHVNPLLSPSAVTARQSRGRLDVVLHGIVADEDSHVGLFEGTGILENGGKFWSKNTFCFKAQILKYISW